MTQQSTNDREGERWKRLLAWLDGFKSFDSSKLCVEPRMREGAGRGLFVKKALHASMEPLLSIPAESLLNSRTLRPIYPSIPLEGFANTSSPSLVINGTQLLSIHLALNRPVGEDSSSRDPRFGPYIDTCPRDFGSHPLTWLVRQRVGTAHSYEEELLRWLPPSSYNGLNEVAKRFWDDWRVALRSKEEYVEAFRAQNEVLFDLEDFLWGWLTVNTRCLYFNIFRKSLPLTNLTLCPVVDLTNHTVSSSLPQITWRDAKTPVDARIIRGSDLLKAQDYVFLPPTEDVSEGEEIFLRYGMHSNRKLFSEYGFVDKDTDQEVDVSDIIDDLIMKKKTGRLIKELLPEVAQQFMSDMKLYMTPSPAQPSWSLQCILRLINLGFPDNQDLTIESEEVELLLKPWRDVTLGEADFVSDENENSVRHDVKSICDRLIIRSSESVHRMQHESNEAIGSEGEGAWYSWAKGCIIQLWKEEENTAISTIENGLGF